MLKKLALAFLFAILAQGTAFAGHTYKIINNLGRDVCEFYVSAHNENDWGDDMLGALDECLHHGYNYTYKGQASLAPTHDVRIVFRDGSDLTLTLNQPCPEGATTNFTLNAQ